MTYNILNENFVGNCVPILITIGNLQSINEFRKTRHKIRAFSVIYGIIGALVIVLLKIDKQSAFEWVGLYSVIYFFLEYIKDKSSRFFSLSEQVEDDNYLYYKIICPFIGMAGLLLLLFTFSPLFSKLICKPDSNIYILAKYNYVIGGISYFWYYIVVKKRFPTKNIKLK